jgi:tryptophanyl-tRNA synthetase
VTSNPNESRKCKETQSAGTSGGPVWQPGRTESDVPNFLRILTGDTPTHRLHLGHWVGSLERRVALQDDYDCYFLMANMHAFTTRADKPADIRQHDRIVKDWLAAGLDPASGHVRAADRDPRDRRAHWFFAMLIPFNKVMRNPTLKTEIETKGLGDTYSFGFPMYAVGQCADILAFRPSYVPVGEDQVPHIEMCRDVALKFNQQYCGVGNRVPRGPREGRRRLPDPRGAHRPRRRASRASATARRRCPRASTTPSS